MAGRLPVAPSSAILSTMASTGANNLTRTALAGFLAWLLPGAGHLYLGERHRGVIFLVVIAATFWGGVAMGGVTDTLDPHKQTAWFMAQISTGAHALAALGCKQVIEVSRPAYSWQARDVAVVYSGVAGLLNLLVILDALSRAEVTAPAATRGRSPAQGRKRTT